MKHLKQYVSNIQKSINYIEFYKNKIQECFNSYLSGKIEISEKIIQELIGNENEIVLKNLNECDAFSGYFYLDNSIKKLDKLYLYRGRICESYKTYFANEIVHVPLNERSKVGSCRFSIPGIPCLYLSSNSYTVWKETGSPNLDKLSISSFRIDDPVLLNKKIIDLTAPIYYIYGILSNEKINFDENKEKCIYLIKLMKAVPLIISCSVVCDLENKRNFKVEYLIPQLIMRCLADNVIGIAYNSNRVDSNSTLLATNLAIPILNYSESSLFGNILKNILVSDSMNLGYFADFLYNSNNLSLLNGNARGPSAKRFKQMFSPRLDEPESTFNLLTRYDKHGSYDGYTLYNSTVFYAFDEYLLFMKEQKYIELSTIKFGKQ